MPILKSKKLKKCKSIVGKTSDIDKHGRCTIDDIDTINPNIVGASIYRKAQFYYQDSSDPQNVKTKTIPANYKTVEKWINTNKSTETEVKEKKRGKLQVLFKKGGISEEDMETLEEFDEDEDEEEYTQLTKDKDWNW